MVEKKRNTPRAKRLSTKNATELSPQTLWTIIAVNALVSLVVSLTVVLVIGPWLFGSPSPSPATKAAVSTPAEDPTASAIVDEPFTATPTARAEPLEYEVQPGDTLGTIAEKFGLSTDELMAMNSLTDPNLIRVGQALYIPAAGMPQPTATPTITAAPPEPLPATTSKFVLPPANVSLTPTPTPSPIPTATAPPLGQISIAINSVLGYGNIEQEQVIIANNGPGVQLVGWTLNGSAGGTYTFPNMFLFNGGQVTVHTTDGTVSYTDLYWGLTQPAWQSGDTVTLKNIKGEIIAAYIIP